MAKDLQQSVLGVRDAGWLRWRYLQRPGVDYQVLSVRSRWLRRPIGVLFASATTGRPTPALLIARVD